MRLTPKIFPVLLVCISVIQTGCGSKLPAIEPYKLEIQQGNVVTSKMLLQLRPGMTKSQVRYILGTPLIVDSFHANRWDYFYKLRQQGQVIEQRRVILDFEDDLLKAVRGDVVPATEKAAEAPVDTSARSVTPPKVVAQPSWLDRLMFWRAKPQAAELATAAAATTAVAAAATQPSKNTQEQAKSSTADATEPQKSLLRQNTGTMLSADAPTLPNVSMIADSPVIQDASAGQALAIAESGSALSNNIERATAPASRATTQPPTSAHLQEQAVKEAVIRWADAWRSKNINAYLDAYADKFKPEGGVSKKAWVAQRKQRLSPNQGEISLVVEDIAVEVKGSQASVQFWQQYKSKLFSDQVTKQLDLEIDVATNRWKIMREFVVDNARKPRREQVQAPEDTNEHLEGIIEQIGF